MENTKKINQLKHISDEEKTIQNQKNEIIVELRNQLKELLGDSIKIISLDAHSFEFHFGFGNLDYSDFTQVCEYIKEELDFEPSCIFENTTSQINGTNKGLNFTFQRRN